MSNQGRTRLIPIEFSSSKPAIHSINQSFNRLADEEAGKWYGERLNSVRMGEKKGMSKLFVSLFFCLAAYEQLNAIAEYFGILLVLFLISWLSFLIRCISTHIIRLIGHVNFLFEFLSCSSLHLLLLRLLEL